MNNIRYILIQAKTPTDLVRMVNEKIEEGYEPCGGVVIVQTGFFQAMFK